MCFTRRQQKELDGGFGHEEGAEAVVDELDADEAFAGFGVADVNNAALGGEVVVFLFASRAGLRERDADVEIHSDGNVEFRFKGGAAAAEIFAGRDFFKGDACDVASADGDGQAHGDAALGAGARGG